MKLNIKKQTKKAFTVVELIIVVIVIGVLATITIVAYNGIQQNAKTASLLSDLDNASAIMAHDYNANGVYPDTVTAADGGRGLPTNSGTTYQYTVNNSATPATFCLTGTNGNMSYYINSTQDTPVMGGCPGHTINGAPLTCPTGFIIVPGSATYGTGDFCVMKYEASNVGGVATSQSGNMPWANISQASAETVAAAACSGCQLMTEAQWFTIAQNVLQVASNWSGGAVGSGYVYSGHNDNAPSSALVADPSDSNGYSGETNTGGNQRRTLTLSNGAVIWDFAGDVWEWTTAQVGSGKPGSPGGAWREWNALTVQGSLSPSPYPSYALAAASGWSSAQGIGLVYSDSNNTNTVGLLHGGSWMDGYGTGIFTLALNTAPTSTGSNIGFRVTK